MKSRAQPVPVFGCLAHAVIAAVAALMLLALVACSGGGGGGGSGTTNNTNTPSTSCGDSATCLATFDTINSDPTVSSALASAISGAGTNGCISYTAATSSPFTFTLTFNDCTFGTSPNIVTVNGNFSMTTDESTYFTWSSTGLSVSGTENGTAVNFSCAWNLTYTFSPTISINGQICGTTIAYPTIASITVSVTPSTINNGMVSQAVVKALMSDGTYTYPAAIFSNSGQTPAVTSQSGSLFTGINVGTDTISAAYTEPATGTVWTGSALLTVASSAISYQSETQGTVNALTTVQGFNYYEFAGLAAGSYVVAATGMSSDVDMQVSITGTNGFASLASPCNNLYAGTRPEDCTVTVSSGGNIWVEIEDAIGGTTFALTAAPPPTIVNSASPTGTIAGSPLSGTVGDVGADPTGTTFDIFSGSSFTYSVAIVGLTANLDLSGVTSILPGIVTCTNTGFTGTAPQECTVTGADGSNSGITSEFSFTVSPGPTGGAGFIIIVTPAPHVS